MPLVYDDEGNEHWDLTKIDQNDLIDGYWYPYGNYFEPQITPEFIERHVSMRDRGFYSECGSHIAAELGYCLHDYETHEITEIAQHATQAMVMSKVMQNRTLTTYEQKAFEHAYVQGYMAGQEIIAKQLYEIAQMGDYKAIEKYLEVRGAFGIEQTDNVAPVTIVVAEGSIIEGEHEHKDNVIPITKQS